MEFKEILAFNGLYHVYENGKVMSNVRKNTQREWYEMHQPITKKGYNRVNLRLAGKAKKYYRVHRLVAELFLAPPAKEGQICVNHKDGNKANNHKDNLEWCTHSENMQHAVINGLMKKDKDVDGKPVRVIFEFPTASTADRFFKIKVGTIGRMALGDVISRTLPITDVEYL